MTFLFVPFFFGSSIDRSEKFARGTILLISDAISIFATMRGKHTSDDLAKSIYRLKDANSDYANSAIARIFSISESTLRGILKRRIGRSDRQKKVKMGPIPYLTLQESRSNGLRTTDWPVLDWPPYSADLNLSIQHV